MGFTYHWGSGAILCLGIFFLISGERFLASMFIIFGASGLIGTYVEKIIKKNRERRSHGVSTFCPQCHQFGLEIGDRIRGDHAFWFVCRYCGYKKIEVLE